MSMRRLIYFVLFFAPHFHHFRNFFLNRYLMNFMRLYCFRSQILFCWIFSFRIQMFKYIFVRNMWLFHQQFNQFSIFRLQLKSFNSWKSSSINVTPIHFLSSLISEMFNFNIEIKMFNLLCHHGEFTQQLNHINGNGQHRN